MALNRIEAHIEESHIADISDYQAANGGSFSEALDAILTKAFEKPNTAQAKPAAKSAAKKTK